MSKTIPTLYPTQRVTDYVAGKPIKDTSWTDVLQGGHWLYSRAGVRIPVLMETGGTISTASASFVQIDEFADVTPAFRLRRIINDGGSRAHALICYAYGNQFELQITVYAAEDGSTIGSFLVTQAAGTDQWATGSIIISEADAAQGGTVGNPPRVLLLGIEIRATSGTATLTKRLELREEIVDATGLPEPYVEPPGGLTPADKAVMEYVGRAESGLLRSTVGGPTGVANGGIVEQWDNESTSGSAYGNFTLAGSTATFDEPNGSVNFTTARFTNTGTTSEYGDMAISNVSPPPGRWSFAIRLYLQDITTTREVFDNNGAGGRGFDLLVFGGFLYATQRGNTAIMVQIALTVSAATYFDLVITHDGQTMTVYINDPVTPVSSAAVTPNGSTNSTFVSTTVGPSVARSDRYGGHVYQADVVWDQATRTRVINYLNGL